MASRYRKAIDWDKQARDQAKIKTSGGQGAFYSAMFPPQHRDSPSKSGSKLSAAGKVSVKDLPMTGESVGKGKDSSPKASPKKSPKKVKVKSPKKSETDPKPVTKSPKKPVKASKVKNSSPKKPRRSARSDHEMSPDTDQEEDAVVLTRKQRKDAANAKKKLSKRAKEIVQEVSASEQEEEEDEDMESPEEEEVSGSGSDDEQSESEDEDDRVDRRMYELLQQQLKDAKDKLAQAKKKGREPERKSTVRQSTRRRDRSPVRRRNRSPSPKQPPKKKRRTGTDPVDQSRTVKRSARGKKRPLEPAEESSDDPDYEPDTGSDTEPESDGQYDHEDDYTESESEEERGSRGKRVKSKHDCECPASSCKDKDHGTEKDKDVPKSKRKAVPKENPLAGFKGPAAAKLATAFADKIKTPEVSAPLDVPIAAYIDSTISLWRANSDNAEAMKDMIKKYYRPENCENMNVPKLDPNIAEQVNFSAWNIEADDDFKFIQHLMFSSVTAIMPLIELAITGADADTHKKKMILMGEAFSDAAPMMMDSLLMLSYANNLMLRRRRMSLVYKLNHSHVKKEKYMEAPCSPYEMFEEAREDVEESRKVNASCLEICKNPNRNNKGKQQKKKKPQQNKKKNQSQRQRRNKRTNWGKQQKRKAGGKSNNQGQSQQKQQGQNKAGGEKRKDFAQTGGT